MIDFENPTYLKLRPVQDSKLDRLVAPLLCPGEEIVQTFQSVRDGVVFTTRRVIAVNVQGVTGMKKAFTVRGLPYRRIQAYAASSRPAWPTWTASCSCGSRAWGPSGF